MALEWRIASRGRWSNAAYWTRPGERSPAVDAYLVWADVTGFRDFAPRPAGVAWLPLLVEAREGRTAMDFAEAVRGLDGVHVPAFYRRPSPELRAARFCTALVPRTFFSPAARRVWEPLVARYEMGQPGASPTPEAPAARPELRECLAVVGVLDDNFAFALDRFRERAGDTTRFDYLWTQDPAPSAAPQAGYGREIAASHINGWMREAATRGHSGEDAVYRLADYRDARRRLAHGTHVLDISCGNDRCTPAEEATRIVGVQFPRRDNWGGMPLGPQMLDGLRYIVERADRLAAACGRKSSPPVVVNVAHANLAGPHDGSLMIEEAMDELIRLRRRAAPCEVVLPAGNNHLSRCHAAARVAPGKRTALRWRVLPDDATPNYLEVWLPDGADESTLDLAIAPPGGRAPRTVRQGEVAILEQDGEPLCTVVRLERPANGRRAMALVVIEPTSVHRRGYGRRAPAGEWTVTLANRGRAAMAIDAYVQRDDPVLGEMPYGRQSRFEDARYRVHERRSGRLKEDDDPGTLVRREGAINALATGHETVVVGGFRRSDGAAAPYSGSGRAGASPIRGPDAMFASDDAPGHRGRLGAGIRSGATVAMDGTSVAVALAVRSLVEQLREVKARAPRRRGAGRPGSVPSGREMLRQAAELAESPSPLPRARPPEQRSGSGRVAARPNAPPGRRDRRRLIGHER